MTNLKSVCVSNELYTIKDNVRRYITFMFNQITCATPVPWEFSILPIW